MNIVILIQINKIINYIVFRNNQIIMKRQSFLSLNDYNPEYNTPRSAFKGSKKTLRTEIRNKILKSRFSYATSCNSSQDNYYNIKPILGFEISHEKSYSPLSTRINARTGQTSKRTNYVSERKMQSQLIVTNKDLSKLKTVNTNIYFKSDNLNQNMNDYLNFVLKNSLENEKTILDELQQKLTSQREMHPAKFTSNIRNSFFRRMKTTSQRRKNQKNNNKPLNQIDQVLIKRVQKITNQKLNRPISRQQKELKKKLHKCIKTTPNYHILD